jgi:beta-ketoacyl-acyl-carrier-protein synthase II
MTEKIVVTGMGAVTPLGYSVPETWSNLVNGVSGVAPITQFDASDFQVQIACEVKNFRPEELMSPREARRRDRYQQFATIAAQEAIRQSALLETSFIPERVGVILSSAIGGLQTLYENFLMLEQQGPRRVSPFVIPMLMSNGAAGMVAIDYGFKGPSFSVASACASGADGIGTAWNLLRGGVIDVAVTGASEATINRLGVAAFDRVGALSRRNQDYSMTPQPFDKNRDGLVMGEGAAILVLETESHARQRGAGILAELAGYAATSDAHHITAPSDDGAGGAEAIRLAMQVAGVKPGEVGYINAHGTATDLNDQSETRAIKAAFGDLAYNIPVSSTKSMTGHMMGATGALELIFCVQALREAILPPTIHYETPDPECDLDYIPNQSRPAQVQVALSNAFGFGGHNAVLVIRRYP